MQTPSAAEMLSIAQAAAELAVDSESVRRWIVRGLPFGGVVVRLPGLRAGRAWRVKRADLAAFLAAINGGLATATAEEDRRTRDRRERAQRLLAEELHGRKKSPRRG